MTDYRQIEETFSLNASVSLAWSKTRRFDMSNGDERRWKFFIRKKSVYGNNIVTGDRHGDTTIYVEKSQN